MVTNLFDQRQDISPIQDPYGEGGLRVWDDYQFRRKGVRWGGPGRPPPPVIPPVLTYPPFNTILPDIEGLEFEGQDLFCTEGVWTGTVSMSYDYQWYRVAFVPTEAPPVNTVIPLISGITVEGYGLFCPTGTWTGAVPLFYEYQWYRMGAVIEAPPSNTTLPQVTGSGVVGSLLSTTNGTWDGSPSPTFTRQWKSGPTYVGTGGMTYTTVPGDVGNTITCVVTATNSMGVASATSNAFGPITAVSVDVPPSNTTPPYISGSVVVGSIITTTNGSWSGTPSPTFTRQWKRGGTNVGTGGTTYTTVSGDIGSTITCVVTATNVAGVVSATSNVFGPITSVPVSGEVLTADGIPLTADGEELTT